MNEHPGPDADRGAAPTDPLADIPGLDPVRGLGLFGGQRRLYLRGLRQFVELYGGGLAALGRYLADPAAEAANREPVRREVHSMGGAAATLGAVDMQQATQRIDALMRAAAAPPGQDAALHAELVALQRELATLVARLRDALARLP